jgi:hypothetical protein
MATGYRYLPGSRTPVNPGRRWRGAGDDGSLRRAPPLGGLVVSGARVIMGSAVYNNGVRVYVLPSRTTAVVSG